MFIFSNWKRRAAVVGTVLIICWPFSGALAGDSSKAMVLRLGSGEKTMDRYLEYGYNAAVIGDPTQLADYDSVLPGVIGTNATLRTRIASQRAKFQKEYDRANKLGIAVCMMTDEVSLPIPVLD